jgi:hypothetical protein
MNNKLDGCIGTDVLGLGEDQEEHVKKCKERQWSFPWTAAFLGIRGQLYTWVLNFSRVLYPKHPAVWNNSSNFCGKKRRQPVLYCHH